MRWKVISILTAFAVVPIALIAVVYWLYIRDALTQQTTDHLQENLKRIEISFDRFVQERISDLRAWSKMGYLEAAIEYDRPEALDDHLRELKDNYSIYSGIALFRKDGALFASSEDTDKAKDLFLHLNPNQSMGSATIQTVTQGKTTYLEISYPIENRFAQPLGILLVLIDWAKLNEMFTPSGGIPSLTASTRIQSIPFDSHFKPLVSEVDEKISNQTRQALDDKEISIIQDSAGRTLALACRTTNFSHKPEFKYLQCLSLDWSEIIRHQWMVLTFAVLILVGILIISFFLSTRIARKLLRPLQQVAEALKHHHLTMKGENEETDMEGLKNRVLHLINELIHSQKKLREESEKAKLSELATRVAHDIQSPLFALSGLLENRSKLPDDSQRDLLRSVIFRIKNLTEDLLGPYRKASKASKIGEDFSFLVPVIEQIMAEKSTHRGQRPSVKIDLKIDEPLRATLVKIPSGDFARILSNVLNNAIDACEQKMDGSILIRIHQPTKSKDQIEIDISDNGGGIPADLLQRLQAGEKVSGKPSGAGIGLNHAREILSRIHGSLEIDSEWNRGTSVRISIPKIPSPLWLVSELNIPADKKILVIDDCESIFVLWKERFKDIDCKYLSSPNNFSKEQFPPDEYIYLVDYEFSNAQMSGLDLIEEQDLSVDAILVSSYYDDARIQERVQKLGTRILPKPWINSIKINTLRNSRAQKSFDFVLIENDISVQKLWSSLAHVDGRKILIAETHEELKDIPDLERVPVFVDRNLGNGIDGIDVGEELYKRGFRDLVLITAESDLWSRKVGHFREVRGKEYPNQL